MVSAREQYEHQEFNYAGPCGENSYVEDYTSSVRGMPTYVVVLVTFNAAGQAQQVVVNHRPRSAMLQFSSLMSIWRSSPVRMSRTQPGSADLLGKNGERFK